MAVEQKRGCGFRKVDGLYLVADGLWAECDRLPLPVGSCPVCGEGTHFPRAPKEINPQALFGDHAPCNDGMFVRVSHYDWGGGSSHEGWMSVAEVETLQRSGGNTVNVLKLCHVCQPTDSIGYLLGVGEKFYSPQTFITEARTLGLSKRIPAMPKHLELGKTWVYLVHRRAMVDQATDEPQMAIFAAFIPQRVEMPVWESQLTDKKREELQKRGITPVPIPDGDKDHAPKGGNHA